MLGENPHDVVGRDEENHAFHTQPLWKRVVIVFAGPLMNLALFVVISGLGCLNGWTLLVSELTAAAEQTAEPGRGLCRPNDGPNAYGSDSRKPHSLQHIDDLHVEEVLHAAHVLVALVVAGDLAGDGHGVALIDNLRGLR